MNGRMESGDEKEAKASIDSEKNDDYGMSDEEAEFVYIRCSRKKCRNSWKRRVPKSIGPTHCENLDRYCPWCFWDYAKNVHQAARPYYSPDYLPDDGLLAQYNEPSETKERPKFDSWEMFWEQLSEIAPPLGTGSILVAGLPFIHVAGREKTRIRMKIGNNHFVSVG